MTSPDYTPFLSTSLVDRLWEKSEEVPTIPNLRIAPGLQHSFPHLETPEALQFVLNLYHEVRGPLAQLLQQRSMDRQFIDERTRHCRPHNKTVPYQSDEYRTAVGERDQSERLVLGFLPETPTPKAVTVPDFLNGNHITIFGPPDTAKMAINAMNSLHHRLQGEHELIEELVQSSGDVPRWGADNEDSKTPIMRNFLRACDNLLSCFDHSLSFEDTRRNKQYRLQSEKLALPIKRIPGLALPDGNHLYDRQPLPLHLYDFAMHLFHNWDNPQALVLYIPKLENEEEAAYIHHLIQTAEQLLQRQHPEYKLGTVRIFVVFENPRAIFRITEMANALHPYFVGGSLGWHDFLASTARLFKCDPNYRIPVKADPNIVINHIRESHLILQRTLGAMGAIAIGGMYGTLYEEGNPESFEVSMVGFIKDVITQMKRGLDGFWVAHPNFVRIGIALVEAWRRYERNADDDTLRRLVCILVPNPAEQAHLLPFVFGLDARGLPQDSKQYERGVLAANVNVSDVIANHDEQEVRYNIFQALQYLSDWLCGNGCVALPAQLTNARGESIFVRIMDDLATTERSRWELWAEVHHGRVSVDTFERILLEEVAFLKADRNTGTKRIQVRWTGDAAKWYPIAVQLLHQLVTDETPVEFVPELLLPFTFDFIRSADDPFRLVQQLHPVYHPWKSRLDLSD